MSTVKWSTCKNTCYYKSSVIQIIIISPIQTDAGRTANYGFTFSNKTRPSGCVFSVKYYNVCALANKQSVSGSVVGGKQVNHYIRRYENQTLYNTHVSLQYCHVAYISPQSERIDKNACVFNLIVETFIRPFVCQLQPFPRRPECYY